ncbi:TOM1-like protein 5 [Glycine soja]|uniref:TOM1-like protein 5 n=1 Tax=Glycine soja TaxID=3848 RepID=A0A445L367_GLYSO|nr:TOM1-like protein 5 [Glycine soja]
MAAELVNGATSEKLAETDWTKNIEICELVAHDKRQARDAVKAIKKRLGSKHPNTQLFAVMVSII